MTAVSTPDRPGSAPPVDMRNRPSSPHILVGEDVDRAVRWRPGERLEHVFEQRCDTAPHAVAVDAVGTTLTFAELEAAANRPRPVHNLRALHRVTAMCCLPSLLATLEEDLPGHGTRSGRIFRTPARRR